MPKIRELASNPVYCVRDTDDLAHARHEMLRRDVDKLVVLDAEDAVVGFLTVRDLIDDAANLAASEKSRLHIRQGSVKDVMTLRPFVVQEEMGADTVIEEFVNRDIVAAPVLDDDELVGIVTAHDLMAVVRDSTEGRASVKDVMDYDVVRLHRHDTLAHAVYAMAAADTTGAVVTEGESGVTSVGVLTLNSILFNVTLENRAADATPVKSTRKNTYGGRMQRRHVDFQHDKVEDAMWEDHPTLKPSSGAHAAANVILTQRVDVVPVADEGAVIGMITKRALLKEARKALTAEA